jgi:hypothetical protein
VEFFLRDLIATLPKKSLNLAEVLPIVGEKLGTLPEGQLINSDTWPVSGRRTWLDVAIRQKGTNPFEEQTGVPPDHEETAADLAVKFYRELQVRKLLSMSK